MTGLAAIQSDVTALADEVRTAAEMQTPLRIIGAATWLDGGPPVVSSATLSAAALTGIVEYVPGDLTMTVRGGTTLAEIRAAAAGARQWLPLDPFGSDSGTIGATIATASAGPLATGFGTPRDMVLGLEAVSGRGAIIRAGGRVVKNVAGYDLVRLFCGSWGTLGVITEATLRLRALPETQATLAVCLDDAPGAVDRLRATIRQWRVTPFAAEIVDAPTAARLGLDSRCFMLLRLGGNPGSLRAQEAAAGMAGPIVPVDSAIWNRLRVMDEDARAAVRFSQLPSRVGELWEASGEISRRWPGTVRHASLLRGIVRCVLPARRSAADTEVVEREGLARIDDGDGLAAALSLPVNATRLFERLPAPLWSTLGPGRSPDSLDDRVKQAFDPVNILNRRADGEPA